MNKDKLEELLNMTKLAELVNTKQKDDEKKYGEGRKARQDPKKRVGRHDQT